METTRTAPASGAAQRAARLATPRLSRELDTIGAMLRIYCRDHHRDALAISNASGTGPATDLCPECAP